MLNADTGLFYFLWRSCMQYKSVHYMCKFINQLKKDNYLTCMLEQDIYITNMHATMLLIKSVHYYVRIIAHMKHYKTFFITKQFDV